MENSNNIQNWKFLIHLFNIPYQEYPNIITLQPNTSPQYEVLSSYLEELEVSELEYHFIIKPNTPFPSGIYQEIIDLHLFHYPIK
jgi:hypothetical protein